MYSTSICTPMFISLYCYLEVITNNILGGGGGEEICSPLPLDLVKFLTQGGGPAIEKIIDLKYSLILRFPSRNSPSISSGPTSPQFSRRYVPTNFPPTQRTTATITNTTTTATITTTTTIPTNSTTTSTTATMRLLHTHTHTIEL